MNKKTLAVLMLMGISLAATAIAETEQEKEQRLRTRNIELDVQEKERKLKEEEEARQKAAQAAQGNTFSNGSVYQDCRDAEAQAQNNPNAQLKRKECVVLEKLSGGVPHFQAVDRKASEIKSQDGAITCRQLDSFTIDYKPCEEAVAAYNWVLNADSVLNLTQEVRTARNDQKLQEDTAQQVAQGESQGAVLDSATKKNEFQKDVEKEKVMAYSAAVAALVYAYQNIPVIDDAIKMCDKTPD